MIAGTSLAMSPPHLSTLAATPQVQTDEIFTPCNRPGDHVLFKTDGDEPLRMHVVIQSVNSSERVARVRITPNRFFPTPTFETVSVLELDPHGGSDWNTNPPVEGLGLHRGEFVFIHKEGSTNGAQKPMVPRIGEMEDWVRESPVANVAENGQFGGWRKTMADIGNDIAQRRGKDLTVEEGELRRPQPNDKSLNWFGEVVDVSVFLLPLCDIRLTTNGDLAATARRYR